MSRDGWTEGLLLGLATLGSGAVTLHLGQDVNFDQLSYHVYLGWSLVAGRLDQDIAPAGLGSFLNPLVQAGHYLGLTRLPVRVFFFLLGALHGANAYLVYRLARRVLAGVGGERPLAALAGLVAAAGPCAVSLLGTTFGDNLLSLPVLAAFLLLAGVPTPCGAAATRRIALAGALGGAAAGLKLTFAIGLLALLAGAFLLAWRARRPRVALAFGAGAVAGGVAAAGWWGVLLWQRFGDPVFPFGSALFPSPFALPATGLDPRWASRGLGDLVTVPAQMALGLADRLQEIPARDPRYLVLLVLVSALLVRRVFWRGWGWREASGPLVVAGWLVLYVAWATGFHYYRYFAVGEMLAPVAILALLRALAPGRLSVAWTAAAAVIGLTTTTGSWGRAEWTAGPLDVRVPFAAAQAPAVVLVDGYRVAFALPFFPPGVRFFGLTGTGEGFRRLVADELRRHDGPVYRLRLRLLPPTPLDSLGLRDAAPCEDFRTAGRGRLVLCRLERTREQGRREW